MISAATTTRYNPGRELTVSYTNPHTGLPEQIRLSDSSRVELDAVAFPNMPNMPEKLRTIESITRFLEQSE